VPPGQVVGDAQTIRPSLSYEKAIVEVLVPAVTVSLITRKSLL
jgi:hypothetical protein